jgi:hypothetical protein
MNRPQDTTVTIQLHDGVWRIVLYYEDGEVWVGRTKFATEGEAKYAALKWALENQATGTSTRH